MARNLSKRVIKNYLDFLRSKLPEKPTAVSGFYKLPKEFENNVIANKFSRESLQKISDHIGYFLGILISVKINLLEDSPEPKWAVSSEGEVYKDSEDPNTSGLYTVRGNEILLIKKQRYNLKHILAILAHEYTHHYLNQYGVRKENEAANEILTEITTAYLGLGQLLVDGYKPIVWTSDHYNYIVTSGHTTHTLILGYVTANTIKKAIILSMKIRHWDPDEVVKSFSSLIDRVGAYLKILPYKIKFEGEKRQRKQFIDDSNFIKNQKVIVKEKYENFVPNFENMSKTINLSSISSEDGKKFVEIANKLSSIDFLNELGNMCENITNNNIIDKKGRINKLNNQIVEWENLLNKYQK